MLDRLSDGHGCLLGQLVDSATCVACACVDDSHWRAVRVSDKGSPLSTSRGLGWDTSVLSSSGLCFASDRGPLVYPALRYLQVGWETSIEPSSRPAPEPAQSLPVAPPGRRNPNRTPPCEPGSPGLHRNWAGIVPAPLTTSSRHTRSWASHHAQNGFQALFMSPVGVDGVTDTCRIDDRSLTNSYQNRGRIAKNP